MQFGPKQFNSNDDPNSVYVIIEQDLSSNTFKVLGVAHSLVTAQTFAKHNVIIKGPIPLLDPKPMSNNIFDFTPKPQFIEPDNFVKPKFDNPFNLPKFDPPPNPFNLNKPEFHFGSTNNTTPSGLTPFTGFNMDNLNTSQKGPRRRYVTTKQSINPFGNNNNDDTMDIC
jgi:hypothetical protein